MIDKGEVVRIREWVDEAVSQGAEVLAGGTGEGPIFQPTLLGHVNPEMKVCREEVFGPVVTISPYQTFEEALASVNDSKYGLQAGVFTNDINRAFQAHRTLEVGGVIVNDVSAFRADQMPYGGVEGLRVRARGTEVRHGRDDRASHHGHVARAAVGGQVRWWRHGWRRRS